MAVNMSCVAFVESLVRIAEGYAEPEAQAHVERCMRCAQKLEQLRTMVTLAKVVHYDAPSDLVASAKALIPKRPVVRAGLLRTSFVSSGARSVLETAQFVVGTEEHSIRLMVQQQNGRAEVLGELPSEAWVVVDDGKDIRQDGNRFRLVAPDLGSTGFVVESNHIRLIVPSVQELLSRGTGSAC